MTKHGKGMLSSVEQAFVGRDEKRAPQKTFAWEARSQRAQVDWKQYESACFVNFQDRRCK